jgi:glycosyltransferase AglD
MKPDAAVRFSIVIPVHDEEAIIETAVRGLVSKLASFAGPFEIILAENGSRDATPKLAEELARSLCGVRVLRDQEANYGRALRAGIMAAAGEYVICDEIDLGDVDFYGRATRLLDGGADLVVGSKRHPDSQDRRPLCRRLGTAAINGLLRLALGFRGTDTHGLKAFRRAALLPIVQRCTVEHDLFASELVIRAGRAGLAVHEIPLRLREIRPPSVHLWRRVPRVLRDIAKLICVIRARG